MKRCVCLIVLVILAFACYCGYVLKDGYGLIVNNLNVVDSYVDNNCQMYVIKSEDYVSIIEKLNLSISKFKSVSDRLIIEGYSDKISNHVVIDNKKVNVQMSISDGKIILGSPLISGSFWKNFKKTMYKQNLSGQLFGYNLWRINYGKFNF